VVWELVDLADHDLPLLDEPEPAAIGHYRLSLFTDMTRPGALTPGDHHLPVLHRMLEEVTAWANALRPLRETGTAEEDAAAGTRR
jgi:hypothetical protein